MCQPSVNGCISHPAQTHEKVFLYSFLPGFGFGGLCFVFFMTSLMLLGISFKAWLLDSHGYAENI